MLATIKVSMEPHKFNFTPLKYSIRENFGQKFEIFLILLMPLKIQTIQKTFAIVIFVVQILSSFMTCPQKQKRGETIEGHTQQISCKRSLRNSGFEGNTETDF